MIEITKKNKKGERDNFKKMGYGNNVSIIVTKLLTLE